MRKVAARVQHPPTMLKKKKKNKNKKKKNKNPIVMGQGGALHRRYADADNTPWWHHRGPKFAGLALSTATICSNATWLLAGMVDSN